MFGKHDMRNQRQKQYTGFILAKQRKKPKTNVRMHIFHAQQETSK